MQIKSLGKIAVPTPGTPVPLSATRLLVWKYRVQAVIGETGKVWLGDSTLHASNHTGEIKTFWPTGAGGGVADAFEDYAGDEENVIDLSGLRLDAQNGGEGAIVSVWIK
jgi:hypothetical protein